MAQLLYHKTAAIFFEKVSHPRPFYYYFENFPADFSPWFLFFPSALILAFRVPYRRRPEIILLTGWFIANFLFFSLAKGKRELYLLPIYPAASLLVAFLWDEYLSRYKEKTFQKLVRIPLYILLGALTLAAFSLPFIVKHKFASLLPNSIFLTIPIALLILGGVAYAYYSGHESPERPFYIVSSIMFLLFVYGIIYIFPQINQFKSARPLSQKIVNIVKTPDKLSFWAIEGADINYYTGFINVKRFSRVEDLKKFFRSSDQVFCLMQHKAFKWIQKNTSIPAYPVISDKVGDRGYVLITNRQ
jgi:4-amino-4-deoxy-L-arabinose transferase-like glycosyltransferase